MLTYAVFNDNIISVGAIDMSMNTEIMLYKIEERILRNAVVNLQYIDVSNNATINKYKNMALANIEDVAHIIHVSGKAGAVNTPHLRKAEYLLNHSKKFYTAEQEIMKAIPVKV